jgi:ketosteroid isomerase-like protein
MPQKNVELVRRAVAAFTDHDFDAVRTVYAEDIEWRLRIGSSSATRARMAPTRRAPESSLPS